MSRAACCLFAWLTLTSSAFSQAMTDIVVTGDDQTLRLRMVILKSGKPWQDQATEANRRLVQAIFAQVDADQNEKLSGDEAKRLASYDLFATRKMNQETFVAFNPRVLDQNLDGSVSQMEFADFVGKFGSAALKLTSVPVKQSADDLFRALDANRDRKLAAAEWADASKLLMRDRDGNRALTPEELRGATSAVGPPEFIAGVRTTAPLKFALKPASNEDPHAEITVVFADPDGAVLSRPRVSVRLGEMKKDWLRLEEHASGEIVLAFNGHRIVFRVQPGGQPSVAARQSLVDAFVAALEQGLVTINSDIPPELKSLFAVADADGDGKLERVELERCLERLLPAKLDAESSRLRLIAFEEVAGISGIGDANRDGRFSVRELNRLPERITAAAGAKQLLDRKELPATSILVLQQGPFHDAPETEALSGAGPAWFVRADRNRDGDLDTEEFLGAPEDFQRLDANKDNLIELEEALLGMPSPETRK